MSRFWMVVLGQLMTVFTVILTGWGMNWIEGTIGLHPYIAFPLAILAWLFVPVMADRYDAVDREYEAELLTEEEIVQRYNERFKATWQDVV